NASTQCHGKPVIVALALQNLTLFRKDRCVRISMCGTKQGLGKRLELARMLLDLGAKHVGEDVAIGRASQTVLLKLVPQTAALRVTHEVSLDAEDIAEVKVDLSTTAEDVEAGDGCQIWVDVNERKPHRYFYFWNILCPNC